MHSKAGAVERVKAYADIRTTLEKKGQIIGVHDMLISAHALSLSATTVTNDVKEFERVVGLELESWVEGASGKINT